MRLQNGRTLLHNAAQSGDGDLVKFLLAKGAYPNARDDAGSTPLDAAIASRQVTIVSLLSVYLPERNVKPVAPPTNSDESANRLISSLTQRRFAVASVALMLIVTALAYWLSLPPRPLPSTAPLDVFSAHRAKKHVDVMAQDFHPSGSRANERVREYICQELGDIGVEYIVYTPLNADNHSFLMARCVLARIKGAASTKAVAMDAHFDSTPYGPGAADDIAGCAAMLETARALKTGPPLMNDVIFAFTDQEEEGTIGAWAFTQHQWYEDVGLMIGLEARGTSGPVLMFETTDQNGRLIEELARAGVNPRTSSTMFDFFKRMPFTSDFRRYKDRVPGYNLAFIDDFFHYHTKLDNPENLSLASLQHLGAYTLGLTKHFGNMPLYNLKAPNATYFNTLGAHMVVYPRSYGPRLTAMALALFVACMAWTLYRKYITVRQLIGAILVTTGIAAVTGTILGMAAWGLFSIFQEHMLFRNNWYCLGGSAMALSVYVGAAAGVRKWLPPQSFLGSGVVFYAIMLLGMQKYLPGGAYAPSLGLVSGSIALAVLSTCYDSERLAAPATLFAALLILPPLAVIFPLLVLLAYAVTLFCLPVLAALLFLLASLAMPQIAASMEGMSVKITSVVFALGLLVWVTAFATNFPSADCPKQTCLSYGMDFDRGEAWWLSSDPKLNDYTAHFFGKDAVHTKADESFPFTKEACFKAPAPFDPLGKTQLEVLEDVVKDGRRKLRLHLDSPRDAQRIWLKIKNVQVFGARMLDHEFSGGKENWEINIRLLPHEGVELFLEVEPNSPLLVHIREESYGIPDFPEAPERPEWVMTKPNRTVDRWRRPESERTFAVCTFDFGSSPKSSL